MTGKEQFQRESDWVAVRLSRAVETIFETLVAIIGSDIEKFNALTRRERGTYQPYRMNDSTVKSSRS